MERTGGRHVVVLADERADPEAELIFLSLYVTMIERYPGINSVQCWKISFLIAFILLHVCMHGSLSRVDLTSTHWQIGSMESETSIGTKFWAGPRNSSIENVT